MTWFGLGSQVDARISRYIDNVVSGGGGVANHASTHIRGGTDEVDGDRLDIDWNPSNYTPTTAPTEVTNVDELTAHLAGLDAEIPDTFAWATGESGAFAIPGSFGTLDLVTIQEEGGGTFTLSAGELTPPSDGTYVIEGSVIWSADNSAGSDVVDFKYQVWNTGTGMWEAIPGHL